MSNNLNPKNIILLGAGPMAREYSKILKHLGKDFIVIGKSCEGVKKFQEDTGVPALSGGISKWNGISTDLEYGIIAVNCEELANTAIDLMKKGVRKILLEKPAGLTTQEIRTVSQYSKKTGTWIVVGYNRRFYASVRECKKLIEDDGGVLSFNFDFTEWCDRIPKKLKNSTTGKYWFLANSSHVIDMAFYLGGEPKELHTYTTGGNKWHPTATIFSGAGITHSGALFSYQSNWDAPGRWGIEVLTRKHRYIFRPLEKLKILKHNTVSIEPIKIDDRLDLNFKPGLFLQTESFLHENPKAPLLDIHKHNQNVSMFYEKIIHP